MDCSEMVRLCECLSTRRVGFEDRLVERQRTDQPTQSLGDRFSALEYLRVGPHDPAVRDLRSLHVVVPDLETKES